MKTQMNYAQLLDAFYNECDENNLNYLKGHDLFSQPYAIRCAFVDFVNDLVNNRAISKKLARTVLL